MVGDIAWIQDQQDIKAKYKIARVIEVKRSKLDGIVRTVTMQYKPDFPWTKKGDKFPKKFKTTVRPVQNIAIIVPADYSDEEGIQVPQVEGEIEPMAGIQAMGLSN